MRYSGLAVVLVPVVAALALAAAPAVRKDPNGIYAVIDSAIVEPANGTPERLLLWGRFALANVATVKDGKIESFQLGFFHPPKPGFMYYTVNPRDEAGTQADWAKLRAAAGTGRLVAWGSHLPTMDSVVAQKFDSTVARIIQTYNGRVRTLDEPVTAPDVFPQRIPGFEKMTPRFRGPVELGFTTHGGPASGSAVPPK